ncbi:MAG: DUF3078 domain-containing protein [Bacteroidota bacterium]
MVIRGCLLYTLLFISNIGFSQVLSVDTIEVSLILPENHRKEIIDQQDTLINEVDPEVLPVFSQVDSLFPNQRFVSSGRIKIQTNNTYSQYARPVMYRHAFQRFLFSTLDTSYSFNPYMLSFHWPDPPKYKPFALSLKYRNREYEEINKFESRISFSSKEDHEYYRYYPLGADTLIKEYDVRPVQKIMDSTIIEKPFITEEIWDSISDPPKLSYEGESIQKRSVYEGMNRLMQWSDPDTKKMVGKRVEVQRPWKYGGNENIQFSQGFQENWAKGGKNSISLLSDLRIHANYKKENVEWESYGINKLGIISAEDEDVRINDDLIELNSKLGLRAGKKWFYSGMLNFKTQFFNNYESNDENKENPISGFLAPGYFTMALGMDYKQNNFTLMLLPVTSKTTLVVDTVKYDQKRYKIPEGKKVDNMGGASFVNNFRWEISNDFNLSSKMDFFYEYMRSDNHVQAEWEIIMDMKINVFLGARIGTYLRYYTNESEKLQFRENLSISFNYKF